MATRRSFLAGAVAAGLSSSAWARSQPPGLVSAGFAAGKPCSLVWREGGLSQLALPGRGHAVARLSADDVLVVGRRPGAFAAAIDLSAGAVRTVMAPSAGGRFAGHGAVSPDGRLLVTGEFDQDTIAGRLVVRDPASGAQTGSWEPGGIEPHDLGFAAGGSRLVAALGGLVRDGGVTGPVLNPGGVRSSVIEVDPASGRVLKRHTLPAGLETLSLRHLGFAPGGHRIGVGMQDQELSVRRPLMAIIEVGGGIELLPMPDPEEIDFRGYVGSVAADAGGDYLMASSPRGGVAGLWSMRDGRWLGGLHLQDACGLAAGAGRGEFWLSSGYGDVLRLRASRTGLAVVERHANQVGFDHHLLRI